MVRFSSHNLPRENGASTYAIWNHKSPDDLQMVGTLYKNTRGKWQYNIPMLRKINECEKFEDAKAMVREILA